LPYKQIIIILELIGVTQATLLLKMPLRHNIKSESTECLYVCNRDLKSIIREHGRDRGSIV